MVITHPPGVSLANQPPSSAFGRILIHYQLCHLEVRLHLLLSRYDLVLTRLNGLPSSYPNVVDLHCELERV